MSYKLTEEDFQRLNELLRDVGPNVALSDNVGVGVAARPDKQTGVSVDYSNKDLKAGAVLRPNESPELYASYAKGKMAVGGAVGADGLRAGASYQVSPDEVMFIDFLTNTPQGQKLMATYSKRF